MLKSISNKKNILNGLIAVIMFLTMFIPVLSNAEAVQDLSTGTFTIHKYRNILPGEVGSGEALENLSDDKIPVSNVGFKIKQTHEYTVENGKVKTVNKIESGSTDYFTDEQGEIKVNDLKIGRYEFTEFTKEDYGEREIPTGIKIPDEPKVFTVELPGTKDNGELFYDVHAYPKNENNEGEITIDKEVF